MNKEELQKKLESKLYFNGYKDAEIEITHFETRKRNWFQRLFSKTKITLIRKRD